MSDTPEIEEIPPAVSEVSDSVEKFTVLRVSREDRSEIETSVAREFPLTIILNDEELVTLLCSPQNLNYLAVGFLASEGLVNSREEIKQVTVDDQRGVVRVQTEPTQKSAHELIFKRVITSGCGRGASFYSMADVSSQKLDSRMTMSVEEILTLVNKFQHASELYLATHGVHSAALCDGTDILVFGEDVGRHNAIDKIFGKCLMEGIPTADRAMVTSGRITSEILHKVAKRGVPIIVSISEPTNLGVRIADTLGITLVASARGKKVNVYTGSWRITGGARQA